MLHNRYKFSKSGKYRSLLQGMDRVGMCSGVVINNRSEEDGGRE